MTLRRHHVSRGWRVLLGAASIPLAVTTAASAATMGAADVLAPPIPPQPGAAAAPPCPAAHDAPLTWREVTGHTWAIPAGGFSSTYDPGDTTSSFQITVDPRNPCRLYRASSGQDLERSTDAGATWQRVFHDAQAGVNPTVPAGAAFSARDLQVTANGGLVMAESGNGDALLRSDDAGRTWTLANNGIEGQPIKNVDVAPSDPTVMYATIDPALTTPLYPDPATESPTGGPAGIYVTRDAGASWTPTVLPNAVLHLLEGEGYFGQTGHGGTRSERSPQVQIDPSNPGHIWIMVNERGLQDGCVIIESQDYGSTWNAPIAVSGRAPSGQYQTFDQFLVARTRTHDLRLYLSAYAPGGPAPFSAPLVSDDDGQSWTPLPVQPLNWARLIADPEDPDRMIYIGIVTFGTTSNYGVYYDYTYDSWRTYRFVEPLIARSPHAPLMPQSPLKKGSTDDPTVLGQADRYGNFYVLLADSCNQSGCYADGDSGRAARPRAANPTQCTVGAFAGAGAGCWHQSLYVLRPPDPPSPPPSSAGGGGRQQQLGAPPPPQGLEMPVARACTTSPVSRGGKDDNGSLTFDGESLLYTVRNETGSLPYQGVVHRMDPVTCSERTPMTVVFDPADLLAVARADAYPEDAVHPYVDTLTYDPNHDVLWLSLRTDSTVVTPEFKGAAQPPAPASIFSAPIARLPGQPPTAKALLRFFLPPGEEFGNGENPFSYDFTDDTIWATSPPHAWGDSVHGGHVTLDGRLISSCFATGGGGQSWVLAGPGRLYVQSEDDETLAEVDAPTCSTLARYHHRNFGEPPAEDEQMACDALTFGPNGDVAYLSSGTSVIWLRDAVAQQIVAYAIPDGVCPFPTTTTYLGAFTATHGAIAELCAQLTRRGVTQPIAQRRIHFGAGDVDMGTGTTGADGVACVSHRVTLDRGAHPVQAHFQGDDQYLPSDGTGRLLVTGIMSVAPPQVRSAPPPLSWGAPPGSGSVGSAVSQPGPVSSVQAVGQSQAQVQVQSQVQSQAHSATQPVVMLQRQRAVQVAAQHQRAAGVTLQAVRARQWNPAVLLAVQMLVLGCGLLVRRPALARRTSSGRALRGS